MHETHLRAILYSLGVAHLGQIGAGPRTSAVRDLPDGLLALLETFPDGSRTLYLTDGHAVAFDVPISKEGVPFIAWYTGPYRVAHLRALKAELLRLGCRRGQAHAALDRCL